MKPAPSLDTLVPADLVAELTAAAEQEHRTPGELVDEAVERYLLERRLFRPDEVHGKIAQGLQSLHAGEALDGEETMAALIAEIDEPRSPR